MGVPNGEESFDPAAIADQLIADYRAGVAAKQGEEAGDALHAAEGSPGILG